MRNLTFVGERCRGAVRTVEDTRSADVHPVQIPAEVARGGDGGEVAPGQDVGVGKPVDGVVVRVLDDRLAAVDTGDGGRPLCRRQRAGHGLSR